MDAKNISAQELMDMITYMLGGQDDWIRLFKLYEDWWAQASDEERDFFVSQGSVQTLYQTLYTFGLDPDEGLPDPDEDQE